MAGKKQTNKQKNSVVEVKWTEIIQSKKRKIEETSNRGLLRNLYAGQEATVRTGHGTTDWFQIGKGVRQGCILSPMPGWLKQKLESRLPGEVCRWHHPCGRKRRTKELLDKSERGEWKCWHKTQHSKNEDHGIWSHHFMANRWGNSGNSVRLYFLGLQNHCRWWL